MTLYCKCDNSHMDFKNMSIHILLVCKSVYKQDVESVWATCNTDALNCNIYILGIYLILLSKPTYNECNSDAVHSMTSGGSAVRSNSM